MFLRKLKVIPEKLQYAYLCLVAEVAFIIFTLVGVAEASIKPYKKEVKEPTKQQCIKDMKELYKDKEKAKKICESLKKLKKKKGASSENLIKARDLNSNNFRMFPCENKNRAKTLPEGFEKN